MRFFFFFVVVVVVVLVVVVLASAEDESSRKTALLSNFQGRAACRHEQRVAFPRNEVELKTILSRAEVKVVRAVSANAHSWNEKFWCGRTEEDEDEESTVNVFVNDLRVVGSGESRAHLFKRGFEKNYVSVDAGMKVRSMLEYIAEQGYALKSVPWFIDQTVGGAFAKLKFQTLLPFLIYFSVYAFSRRCARDVLSRLNARFWLVVVASRGFANDVLQRDCRNNHGKNARRGCYGCVSLPRESTRYYISCYF